MATTLGEHISDILNPAPQELDFIENNGFDDETSAKIRHDNLGTKVYVMT